MNGSEIALRVKRQFGDEAGAQITDSDILRWVNDAQREIAVHNDLLQTIATTTVVANEDQYPLPPDVLTLRSVRFGGRKLAHLSQGEVSNFIQSSGAGAGSESTGTPTHYSSWGLKIDLYPTPASANLTAGEKLQIYYTRQPTPMASLVETPELPLQYHNRIVEYCIAQSHELDDNAESYKQKMQQFKEGVDQLKYIDNAEQDVYSSISVSLADVGSGDYY